MSPSFEQAECCIHQAFAQRAARQPDAISVRCGQQDVTYGELDARSSQLANYLTERGAGSGSLVAVLMDRSVGMITALLGVLKAGGAYLALNTEDPAGRIGQILSDAQPHCVITQRSFAGVLADDPHNRVYLDEELPTVSRCAQTAPTVTAMPADLAYVCYTSGSTGIPKGVCVPHRGVGYLARMAPYDSQDVFLQLASLAFDSSVFEIWACLLNGGRLVLHPPWPPTPDGLARLVRDEDISVLLLPTGLFHRAVDGHLDSLSTVRHMIVGGDALSPGHAKRAWHALRSTTITNGYGVTESTCLSCLYDIAEEPVSGRPVPIGRPIPGTRAYVLDGGGQPCDRGQLGELYLAGQGLAIGYLGQTELTRQRFLPDPFSPGDLMYRTGDLATWLKDDVLEFHGRTDNQLKIRGFRVESGEIEAFLTAQPGVREAVVIAHASPPGEPELRLGAYLTTDARPGTVTRIRAAAHRALPAYMVPASILVVGEIPLTANGKVDRAALPRPPQRRAREIATACEPPRTPLEAVLCDLVADTLGLSEVGIWDDFRELGGNSLTAAELRDAVRAVVGGTVMPGTLYRSWNVAKLAQELAAGVQAARTDSGSR